MGDGSGGWAWRRVAAVAGAVLAFAGIATEAGAQSRARGRGASQLRQAPPEDPDEPSEGFSAPTGTFSSALNIERQGRAPGRNAADTVSSTSVLGVRLGLPAGFAVHTVLHLEPVEDAASSHSRLPGHAAWAETLNLRWQVTVPLLLFGGKIHPRFGAAWFRVPGLYGADYAGDYELREKIGGGAELDLDALFGTPESLGGYELRVEAFGADTSFLSGGVFRPRWSDTVTDPATGEARTVWRRRNARALGGADNAPGLPGVVVSLVATGVDLPGDAAMGYSLAASWREPGVDATGVSRGRRERGATGAVFWDLGLPFDLRLQPLVEATHQEASGGFAGSRATWLTASATLRRGPLAVSWVEMRRWARDTGSGFRTGREHAANVTFDLGALSDSPLLRPVSLTLDRRRVSEGGRGVTDWAGGVLVSVSF